MFRTAYYALWLVQPLLKAVILAVMYRKKLHLRYPVFFSYLAYGIAVTVLLFSVRSSYRTYFYAYWSTDAVASLLALGVIYELFIGMFRQHHALRDFGTLLFRWSIVVVALMASLLLLSSSGVRSSQLVNLVMNVERSVTSVECGMLLFLVLFSRQLAIPWRHQMFGIALGLGAYACVLTVLDTHVTRIFFSDSWMNILRMSTYDWTLITWLTYMLMPAPVESPNLLLKPQRWNDALLDATRPDHGPVLLGIEDIVERTLKGSAKPTRTA